MRDGAAFDVDDVLRQPELARDDDGDRGEGFIDLDALDGAHVPAGALQGLRDRGHRSQSEHARFDRSNAGKRQGRAVGARPRWSAQAPSASTTAGSSIVQSRGVAGGDGAVGTERRLEPRQCFERRVGPVVLVLVEWRGSLLAGDLHRHDLRFEITIGLRGGEALLRSQGPAVLRLAGDLVFLDQILGMPAGMRVRETRRSSHSRNTLS